MTSFRVGASRTLVLALTALLAVAMLTAAFLWLTRNRYIVYADDEVRYVRGEYDTVGEVLSAAGVNVNGQDLVVPAITEHLGPSQAIRVERADAVTVRTEAGTRQLLTLQPNLAGFLAEAGITIQPSDKVYADGVLVGYDRLDEVSLASEIEIGNYNSILVKDGQNTISLHTSAQAVGDALNEAGVIIYATDGVQPELGAWIQDGMEIVINRAQAYTVDVDGRLVETRSHHNDALAVVAEAGIGLVGQDYVVPAPGVPLAPGALIRVVRVTTDYQVQDEPIPFETLWQPTDQVEIDERGLLSAGVPGILRRRVEIRYENGVEVGRQLSGEWVAREPVSAVMGYGTSIVVRTISTPEGALEYWRKVRMRVTSYTASSSGKPPSHPAYGITASGQVAGTGIVAVDPKVVPFRSWVYVPGYGSAYAGDTGGGVKGRWIDLGFDEDEYQSWSGYVDVYYLTPVPPADKINFLIPTSLP